MSNTYTGEQKDMVFKLRGMSGAGAMDCSKALKNNNWNIDEALVSLRERKPHRW